MKQFFFRFGTVLLVFLCLILTASCGNSSPLASAVASTGTFYTIDHSCTVLSSIPAQWIDSVQADVKLHYAHTSHGGQLVTGLQRIGDSDTAYKMKTGSGYLPDGNGYLCIFDGQEGESYITTELFWESAEGMNFTRDVLDNNPSINVCMWCWCSQMDYYGESEVQGYLNSMSTLESEYPDVSFVYMTGNAQATGSDGYNRYLRNQQVRQYCRNNGRILFDFADLDCWYSNSGEWEQHTYNFNGNRIPSEHPEYY